MSPPSCTSGSRVRTRPRGSTGGRGASRSGGQPPASGRTAGSPSSGRTPCAASFNDLDLERRSHELDPFSLRDPVGPRDPPARDPPAGDPVPGSLEGDRDVHPEHADLRVVLHPLEVRVVRHPEGEIPQGVEAVRREPIVPDRQRLPEELVRLRTSQGHAGADGHVPTDAPVADRAPAQRLDGLLPRDDLEDLHRLQELLPRLAHADVHDDLLHGDRPHRVRVRHAFTSIAGACGTVISGVSRPITKTFVTSVENPSLKWTTFARGFRVRSTRTTWAISPTCCPPIRSAVAPSSIGKLPRTPCFGSPTFRVEPVV